MQWPRPVAMSWQTIGAVLRIATHPRVFAGPISSTLAWSAMENRSALLDPRHLRKDGADPGPADRGSGSSREPDPRRPARRPGDGERHPRGVRRLRLRPVPLGPLEQSARCLIRPARCLIRPARCVIRVGCAARAPRIQNLALATGEAAHCLSRCPSPRVAAGRRAPSRPTTSLRR
jgi:hypothetical protein